MKLNNYEYLNEETPEERLRNKLSVVFLAIEIANCDENLIKLALEVIPEIKVHLNNIKEFYEKRNNNF